MNLASFDPTKASAADILSAQKALRVAKCYNGALDGDFGFYCRAALRTFQEMQAFGGFIGGFKHRSAVLVIPGDGDGGATRLFNVGPGMIDGDGSGGNIEHDPCFQSTTSLKLNGRYINSRVVPGSVITELERSLVKEKVLGSRSRITHMLTGKTTPAVAYDLGGPGDDGEMSIAAAHNIGVNASPISGGEPRPVIIFETWPGHAALVNGVQYALA